MLGEETVLLKALEGKRGQPEQRPPHPTGRGLFGKPTVVNNVQTLAAVPWIIRDGAAAFAAIGARTARARSSSSSGRRRAVGSPRCRWGRSCGSSSSSPGSSRTRSMKAVLVGGPTGGLLPSDLIDTAYDFDALREAGAHIGSGSVVIADDRACVVDLARLLTRFSAARRAARRSPAGSALRRLYEIGDRVATGPPRAHRHGAHRPRPDIVRPACASTSG